jgi:hypothetical protein
LFKALSIENAWVLLLHISLALTENVHTNPCQICMVKTVCNHIKKLLILLQIDVKSNWRFCKKVDKDGCKIYGKLSYSFIADLVKMDGHCCFISNSISIGVS